MDSPCLNNLQPATHATPEIWIRVTSSGYYGQRFAVALIYYVSIVRRDLGAARRPLPLIGNLLDLRGNLHHTVARVRGPVTRLKLGLTTVVVISSRDAAREAFTRHDRRLGARALPDATHALGFSERSVVWLPSSDPPWKTLRGIVASHLFTPPSLAAVHGVRERKVRELISYFRDHAGQEVDIVSSAICSVDVVDVGAESATGLRKLVEDLVELIATPNVSDLYPFLRPLDLQGWRRFAAKHMEKIFSILDAIVDRRSAEIHSSKDRHNIDFLDALLELMSTGKMARDNVTAILFDLFTAGSDTIAITVEWAMAELLHNPSIKSKVRAEIKGVLGCKEIIEEPDAAGLPYLQAVGGGGLQREGLRVHPVRVRPADGGARRAVHTGVAAARVLVAAAGRRAGGAAGREGEVHHRQRPGCVPLKAVPVAIT